MFRTSSPVGIIVKATPMLFCTHAQSLGGKLVQAYYCLGEYDVVAIWEFPDNRTAMKAAVLNASLGHIQITTMPAVARDEWKQILQETVGKRK